MHQLGTRQVPRAASWAGARPAGARLRLAVVLLVLQRWRSPGQLGRGVVPTAPSSICTAPGRTQIHLRCQSVWFAVAALRLALSLAVVRRVLPTEGARFLGAVELSKRRACTNTWLPFTQAVCAAMVVAWYVSCCMSSRFFACGRLWAELDPDPRPCVLPKQVFANQQLARRHERCDLMHVLCVWCRQRNCICEAQTGSLPLPPQPGRGG